MIASEKIRAELEKVTAKITALQEKQAKLQKDLVESENYELASMGRSVNMTPEQLAAFTRAFAEGRLVVPNATDQEGQNIYEG